MENEGDHVVKKQNGEETSNNKNNTVDPSLQMFGAPTEIIEETPLGQHRRRDDLVLEIPSRTLDDAGEDFVRIEMALTPTTTPKGVNFSPMPSPIFSRFEDSPVHSSSKSKSSLKNLLPMLSFKYRNTNLEIGKDAILALGGSSAEIREKPRISRMFSLSKLFTPRMKNTSSLPGTPTPHSNSESTHGGQKGGSRPPIHRSLSVPALSKDGSITELDSLGGVFRIIPTTPLAVKGTVLTTSNTFAKNDNDGNADGGEDIPEEEAVCRICLTELGEGAETSRWNVAAKQEVQNLPVTLLRVQNVPAQDLRGGGAQQAEAASYRQVYAVGNKRVWQDVPILVIVSMLAYFCFLEQLLVSKMKSGAIAVSLPFSCILGVLASMTSSTMVRRKYVWVYAIIQFGLVVLSAHLFYSLLHVQAVLSVLLSAFVGFGSTMCVTSILYDVSRRRRRLGSEDVPQPDQPPVTTQQTQTDTQPNETERRALESRNDN